MQYCKLKLHKKTTSPIPSLPFPLHLSHMNKFSIHNSGFFLAQSNMLPNTNLMHVHTSAKMGERKRKNLDTLGGDLLEPWILLSYGFHFTLLWFLLDFNSCWECSSICGLVVGIFLLGHIIVVTATAPLLAIATVAPLPAVATVAPLSLLLLRGQPLEVELMTPTSINSCCSCLCSCYYSGSRFSCYCYYWNSQVVVVVVVAGVGDHSTFPSFSSSASTASRAWILLLFLLCCCNNNL